LQHRATIDRVIEYVCGRQRLTIDDAEEFAGEVRLRLVENDYAVLRRHEGRSKLSTYLVVVVHRLLLDYRIRSWGKWRPSAEARRAGPVGIALDELMTRDDLPFDEALAVLAAKFEHVDRGSLERLAAALPHRTRRRFEPEGALVHLPSQDASPDMGLEQREAQALADRLVGSIRTHASHLDATDQLLLRLRFEDGRTVQEIATILRVEAKPLYRRIERLLDEIRRLLESDGVTAGDVQDVLQHRDVLEWERVAERIPVGRPSHAAGGREWS